MYNTINSFVNDWRSQSELTLKLFRNLSDASLSQKVYPEGRSLGFIAWHLTTAIGEMLEKVGLETDSPAEGSPMPQSAVQIADAYAKASASVIEEINKKWTDQDLLKEVNMYGQNWANGYTLTVLAVHEIHHRGQMTVLMRQAGLRVPGVCGPSKEEMIEMGFPAVP